MQREAAEEEGAEIYSAQLQSFGLVVGLRLHVVEKQSGQKEAAFVI